MSAVQHLTTPEPTHFKVLSVLGLEWPDTVSLVSLCTKMGVPYTPSVRAKVGKILTSFGWERRRVRKPGSRSHKWFRPQVQPAAPASPEAQSTVLFRHRCRKAEREVIELRKQVEALQQFSKILMDFTKANGIDLPDSLTRMADAVGAR